MVITPFMKPIAAGTRFGSLVVIGPGEPIQYTVNGKIAARRSTSICVCDCNPNRQLVIRNNFLLRGKTRSCGCKLPNRKVKIGDRFGRLSVVGVGKPSHRHATSLCICDCNKEKVVSVLNAGLLSGKTTSCGCDIGASKMRSITPGTRFGRLIVVKPGTPCISHRKDGSIHRTSTSVCVCDCTPDKKIVVKNSHLKRGFVKSCGCLHHEKISTHGKSHTRLFRIWNGIKNRCYNHHTKNWESYGGRGIEMCPEWKSSFQNFYSWASKAGYKDNLSIDRIDVNKGYYPDNCRFADPIQQSNNRRTNITVEYKGDKKTLSEWARSKQISYPALLGRLNAGWRFDSAIETPVRSYARGGTKSKNAIR